MRKQVAREHGLKSGSASADWIVTRRDFLKVSASVAAALSTAPLDARAWSAESAAKVRFGIVTDAHYADTQRRGSRYYRQSVAKMAECVGRMNDEKVDFLIELGDFKDQGAPAVEKDTIEYLRTIEKAFHGFQGPCYHVLGNHDADSISKEQFLAVVKNTNVPAGSKYYSFDLRGLHFVVLDANYRADGSDYDHGNFNWTDANLPDAELKWLKRDLASTPKPVIAFVHQQLDGKGSHYIKNAEAVRQILEKHKRVLAVFQGHNHAGHYSRIEGIHYYTLKAMVEGSGADNNAYAVVEVYGDHGMSITGYRKAVSKAAQG